MRVVLRKRYYCDHCKKAGGASGHMKRHEASCTNNPNRICRLHYSTSFAPAPLPELIALVRSLGTIHASHEDDDGYYSLDDAAVAKLRIAADGCPVCMFAALRQAGAFASSFTATNMKDECKSIWADINEEQESRRHYG